MSDISDFLQQLNSIVKDTSSSSKPLTNQASEPVSNSSHPSLQNTILEVKGINAPTPAAVPKKQVKVLIVSTHVNQINGYSKVVYNIIKQLSNQPWINVVHFGTQKIIGGDINRKYPDNVKVIDGSALEKNKQLGFAFSELPQIINNEKPDIVFIYNDLSIVCGYIEEIRKTIQNRFFKIWAYVDITYNSPPQNMIDTINRDVERVFCFTKTWKDELKKHGITRPVDVMAHGIDTTIIRRVPRELARQTLGLPKDITLITSINKNIPRKRLDLLIIAFAKLIVRFPVKPIFMLLVADMGTKGGFPLFEIFAREVKLNGGSIEMFGNRLLITNKDTCYKDEDINLLNNCADLGVSCADGEGFGLCTFEQMAVGVPQIVPDINGYSEYCNENNSILIKPTTRYYIPQAYNVVTGEAYLVDPEDVSKAIEKYLFDENLRKLHSKNGIETVKQYTWNKCVAPLIKRLENCKEDDD